MSPPDLGRAITGRFSRWLVIVIALLITGGVMATGSSSSSEDAPDSLPSSAESAKVADLQKTFPGGDTFPAIAVVTRDGQHLTSRDREFVAQVSKKWHHLVGAEPSEPVPAPDGKALLVNIPVSAKTSGLALTDKVTELREAAAAGRPDGLNIELTGGSAFAADISSAFDGADIRLLASTAAVVALLLLLTYRSPVLWLIPLIVVGAADRLAATLIANITDLTGQSIDGSTSGITSVLVFGAGTNYALLLVSRYREELRHNGNDRTALASAVRGAGSAIIASNVTVVLSLLTLLLTLQPNSRLLGMSAAVGLVVAAVFVLFVLPAALAIFGRKLFWPFIPRPGHTAKARSGPWFRVAKVVSTHPVRALTAGLVILALLASGLGGVTLGLSQTDQFRVDAESVDGLNTLSNHFPAGAADPVIVIARADQQKSVLAEAKNVDGVVSARPAGTNASGLAQTLITIDAEPATSRSLDTVSSLRSAVHDVSGADAKVGGSVAQDLDSRHAAEHDLTVVVPLILLVVFIVLCIVLRALVAPVILVVINLFSTLAALGLGTWVSTHVFGFPALDLTTPLYVFLFLVALGIDYTIFLVVRARQETSSGGTRHGIVNAVGLTGGVITSAGIVLASVFAVLGVLPLITLTQIGIIVGLGILLDTFLVRSIVVPAVFCLAGDRIWLPSKPQAAARGD